MLHSKGISQIPVTEGEQFIGSIKESNLLRQFMDDPDTKAKKVRVSPKGTSGSWALIV